MFMNTKWLLALTVCLCGIARLGAQGTALTYQGRLTDQGSVASGVYEVEFSLHNAVSDRARVAGPITNSTVAVSNGTFTTTIDFGIAAFNGNPRWLQIGVRTNGSALPFDTLSPRQPVTPTPYAIVAANFTGVVSDSQLSANIARLNANQSMNGDLTIANPHDLNFGNSTRQMINLWSTNFCFGVQNNVLYARSDSGFAWFRDGVHTNTPNHAGAGGTTLMILNQNGNLSIGTNPPAHRLDVGGHAAVRGSLMVNHDSTQDSNFPELPGILFGDYNSGESFHRSAARTAGFAMASTSTPALGGA